MKILFSFLLSFLFLTACAQKELAVVDPIPQDTIITVEVNPLTYTGCDICRRYKVFIFADGTVIFDGVDLVGKLGVVRFQIATGKVKELIGDFERAKFLKMNDTYDIGDNDCLNPVNHGWQVLTSIQMEGKTKTIRHYSPCPNTLGLQDGKILNALREKIEETAEISKWVGRFADGEINEILRKPFSVWYSEKVPTK